MKYNVQKGFADVPDFLDTGGMRGGAPLSYRYFFFVLNNKNRT
jgi:hypothetical protein